MIKAVVLSLFSMFGEQAYPDKIEGRVVNVIDGNTLEVLTEEDEVIKVMLKHADCPEPGQEFAEEARQFTEDLVLRKKVAVEFLGKDRWGNKLVNISRKGTQLHEELLKEGLAWSPQNKNEQVITLEKTAKEKKFGLWNTEDPTPPWVYRKKQTMLQPKTL